MKNEQKRMSVLLCVFLVVCMSLSIIYTCKENQHHCIGQGCPVCIHIHAAQDLMNHLNGGLTNIIFVGMGYVIFMCLGYSIEIIYRLKTLITLKVELLN